MIHEIFDIEYWKTVFPFQQFDELFPDYPYLDVLGEEWEVTSPFHLVMNEHRRQQTTAHKPREKHTLIDIFVWAYGEPSKREVTKMGGLPYFPASRPWPKSVQGEPLEFLAQVCFKDSSDICGSLPGDILIIFVRPDPKVLYDDAFTDDRSVFHFEWVSIADFPLVLPTDLPTSKLNIFPCYGLIHRTVEPMEGTKIGGTPSWIQEEVALQGQFLFQMHSIAPESFLPYPFTNVPSRPGLPPMFDYVSWDVLGYQLGWGDRGQIYFFFDGTEISWVAQCS